MGGDRVCFGQDRLRVADAPVEWVDWLNNHRLMEVIGNIPPAEAEERYHAMLNRPAMAV